MICVLLATGVAEVRPQRLRPMMKILPVMAVFALEVIIALVVQFLNGRIHARLELTMIKKAELMLHLA